MFLEVSCYVGGLFKDLFLGVNSRIYWVFGANIRIFEVKICSLKYMVWES
jgi:hypothetical protein